jgi:hypothetical protein
MFQGFFAFTSIGITMGSVSKIPGDDRTQTLRKNEGIDPVI